MRVVASFLLGVIAGSVGAAAGQSEWVEHSHVYAIVAGTGNVPITTAIIVHVEEALEPLGFHRYSTSVLYDRASYETGDKAATATVNPGSRGGCIVFSATNHDEHAAGLSKVAAAAVEARFRKSFGSSVTFFTDATCSHAL
jgi:hypothetical protein